MQARTITTVDELGEVVGQELSAGDWFEVSQERINAFADATEDHQWIHVDPERAKSSPFGGTIAHGFLTLSLSLELSQQAEGIKVRLPAKMEINYGLNRVRFPNPVRSGKRIRARTKLLSVEEVQPSVFQVVNEITIDIEDEAKPAMVAELITRSYL